MSRRKNTKNTKMQKSTSVAILPKPTAIIDPKPAINADLIPINEPPPSPPPHHIIKFPNNNPELNVSLYVKPNINVSQQYKIAAQSINIAQLNPHYNFQLEIKSPINSPRSNSAILLDAMADVIILPITNFGQMIDVGISVCYNADLQKLIYQQIKKKHRGILAIGDATIMHVSAFYVQFKFLIVIPIASDVAHVHPLSAFLAMKAALELIDTYNHANKSNPIKSISAWSPDDTRVYAKQIIAAFECFFGGGFATLSLDSDSEKIKEYYNNISSIDDL